MYYSETYTTKWHDTDPFDILRPSRLLEYMQETGNHQCRDYGMDLNTMFHERGMGFLLSRIRVSVYAPIHAYEEIEVRTWCPPSRGLSFLRCFSVHRDGKVMAEALSTWALADARNKTLIKVSDFHGEFPTGDPIDESVLPKNVRIPRNLEMEAVGERKIVYSDLDFNRHMNNTKYPDMICDFLPPDVMMGKRMSTLSMSYAKEAAFGDTVKVYRLPVVEQPDTYLLRTVGPHGDTCFEAEVGLVSI